MDIINKHNVYELAYCCSFTCKIC